MSAHPQGAPDEAQPRVLVEKRGRVAWITLNRPQALNAMDLAMHEELAAVWDDFEQDPEIWVGVLRGAGERAFSVGQDLKELARRNDGGEPSSSFGSKGRPGWPRLTERFNLSKPLLARVDGYALGGGFELALACDIIVASSRAVFGLPEATLGLVPGAGGIFRLCRQLPQRTALGYLLTGRRLDAQRALALGLINQVVPADELDACVDSWLDDLLRCAPLAVRAIKEAAMTSLDLTLPQAFEAEYHWERRRRDSADSREGARAFAERRPPVWQGR